MSKETFRNFLLLCFVLWVTYMMNYQRNIINHQADEIMCYEQERFGSPVIPNDSIGIELNDSVIAYMKQIRIKYPEIVYSQALLESGTFTSGIFRHSNNMFGMKYPKIRPTLAIGKYKGYAKFETWQDCIDDYLIYQSLFIPTRTKKDYFNYLGSRYAEDPNYVAKIKRMSNEYKELF